VLVVPVVLSSPDRLGLLGTVVSAHYHTVGGWVAALVTPSLTFGLASRGLAGEDVG